MQSFFKAFSSTFLKTLLKPLAISFACGLLVGLSYAPFNLWWLGLLALSFFIRYLWAQPRASTLICIYFFWAAYFLVSMHWVQTGLSVFQNVSEILATLFTLFFGFTFAAIITTPWLILILTKPGSIARLTLFPFIWIITEWMRYYLFDGLAWLLLGHGQLSTWLAGWIPLLGTLGASFFAVLTSILLAFISIKGFKNKTPFISVAIIFAIWVTGLGLSRFNWTTSLGIHLPVTVIQPNRPMGIRQHSSFEEAEIYWQNKNEQLGFDKPEPGLLVWPEGALRFEEGTAPAKTDRLNRITVDHGIALITGAPIFQEINGEEFRYNGAIGLGKANGNYKKTHRAPLGEYSPLGGRLGRIIPHFNTASPPYQRAKAVQTPMEINLNGEPIRAGISICYEIAFPRLSPQTTKNSNLLINLSNDIWFKGSHELDQALQIAQSRALENQKPLIRAANTGITALINHKGQIVRSLERDTQDVLRSHVNPREGQTPYSRWGDIPILVIGLILALSPVFAKKIKPQRT